MIPHRIRLALVALAAACASASCLDERVRVPVRVAAVDDGYNVKQIAMFDLAVRKGSAPARDDEHHHGERRVEPGASGCVPQDEDATKDEGFVESRTTGLDGAASFELVPGDYVLCSRQPAKIGGMQWAVPFRVDAGGVWEAARREPRDGGCVWVYPERTGGEEPAQLVLSNNNAQQASACAQTQTADAQAAPKR
ncbi:MAG: hypothetical protein LC746_04200 [Acidobacteria bacterium]|nr:hypothetical protein [Acidobacteriota bacterium]